MAFNGSGSFLINSAGQPVVTGTTISSTAFNALTADLATGLTTCITKDGQTTPTANIPMGGFKVTGIGVATTTGDALSYGRAATVTTLAATGNMGVASGGKFYLDGVALTGDTYISETSANVMTFTAGGSAGLSLTASAFNIAVGAAVSGGNLTLSGANNLIIPAAQYFYIDGGGDTYIREASANVMTFATGGTERARVTAAGYSKMSNTGTYVNATGAYHEFQHDANSQIVSIANSNATMNSTITGIDVYYSGAAPNSTVACFLYCEDTGALRASIRSNGGLANFSANNVNLSDESVKTNIQPATPYLSKMRAIPVKTFLYKDQTDSELNLGVIAQDVDAVAPELVDHSGFNGTEGKKLLAIYQTDFQYATLKALQELADEFDAYKAAHP